jgi:DOPA 4,5-dioxygenase
MNTIPKFDFYHAHLYYNEDNMNEALKIGEQVNAIFSVGIGHFHQKPVGPHPAWSCQISVPVSHFSEIIQWLLFNRGSVDIFIHPDTGEDLIDHTQRLMWIGKSYSLNTQMFH